MLAAALRRRAGPRAGAPQQPCSAQRTGPSAARTGLLSGARSLRRPGLPPQPRLKPALLPRGSLASSCKPLGSSKAAIKHPGDLTASTNNSGCGLMAAACPQHVIHGTSHGRRQALSDPFVNSGSNSIDLSQPRDRHARIPGYPVILDGSFGGPSGKPGAWQLHHWSSQAAGAGEHRPPPPPRHRLALCRPPPPTPARHSPLSPRLGASQRCAAPRRLKEPGRSREGPGPAAGGAARAGPPRGSGRRPRPGGASTAGSGRCPSCSLGPRDPSLWFYPVLGFCLTYLWAPCPCFPRAQGKDAGVGKGFPGREEGRRQKAVPGSGEPRGTRPRSSR